MSATRKKVKLAFICNAAARKASLKKRTRGMLTKVNELSTLCGVDACMIMYGPDESQPIAWASSPGVHGVLAMYQRMSETSQNKYMMDQETFLAARLSKIQNKLEKQIADTREKEVTRLMFSTLTGKSLDTLSLEGLEAVRDLVNKYLLDIKQTTERLNSQTEGYDPVPVTERPSNFPVTEEIVQEQQPPIIGVDDMEMMNPMGFSEEDAMLSIGENNFSPIWSNELFY